MPVWTVAPKRRLSGVFVVLDAGGGQVGGVRASPWLYRGAVRAGDMEHGVHRDGTMGGAFVLEEEGRRVAHAVGRSALRQAVTIVWNDKDHPLVSQSAWRRGFTPRDREREIGRVVPERASGGRAHAELPDDLPLAVRLFVIWLVELFWKRGFESHWRAWGMSIPLASTRLVQNPERCTRAGREVTAAGKRARCTGRGMVYPCGR